jgi:hypothetical protein
MKYLKYFENYNSVDDLIRDITFFETAQGSKYIRTSDGRIRRWKSVHANTGGEDKGLHGWNQQSMFVSPDYEKEANSIQFLIGNGQKNLALSKNKADGKIVVMVTKDNQWRPGTWLDAYPKFCKFNPDVQNKILAFEYKIEPTIGYHVVDFNLKQNGTIESYHFGSPVTKILTGEQMSGEDKKLFFPSKI